MLISVSLHQKAGHELGEKKDPTNEEEDGSLGEAEA